MKHFSVNKRCCSETSWQGSRVTTLKIKLHFKKISVIRKLNKQIKLEYLLLIYFCQCWKIRS